MEVAVAVDMLLTVDKVKIVKLDEFPKDVDEVDSSKDGKVEALEVLDPELMRGDGDATPKLEMVGLGRGLMIRLDVGLKLEGPVLGDDDDNRPIKELEGEPFTMTGLPVIDDSDSLLDGENEVVPERASVFDITGLSVIVIEDDKDDIVEFADGDGVLLGAGLEIEPAAKLNSLAPQTPLSVTPEKMVFFM